MSRRSDELSQRRSTAAHPLQRHRRDDDLRAPRPSIEREWTGRDGLTGALQRAAGEDRLAREVERTHRRGGVLTFALLHVDALRTVNVRDGQAAGDAVLLAVGAALVEILRTHDLVVRWRGDEFICALPATAANEARRRFREVRERVGELNHDAGFSVGIAELEPNDSLPDVIDRAEHALHAGRRRPAGGSAAS